MPDEGAAKTPSTPASPAPATPVAKVTPPPPVTTTPARDGEEIRLGAGCAPNAVSAVQMRAEMSDVGGAAGLDALSGATPSSRSQAPRAESCSSPTQSSTEQATD